MRQEERKNNRWKKTWGKIKEEKERKNRQRE